MITSDKFKNTVLKLASILPKFCPDFKNRFVIEGYWEQLKGLHPDDLERACHLAARTLDEFPSIRKLIELSSGNILDADEIGQDVSSKIEKSIVVWGYTNPGEARMSMGELAWEVVQSYGGWHLICNLENEDLPSARKKWRETAVIIYKKYRMFGKDDPMAIPEKIDNAKSELLNDALKLIKTVSDK